MNRLIAAICLSTSLLALGIASLTVLHASSRATDSPAAQGRDLDEMRLLLASLEGKVAELEKAYGALVRRDEREVAPSRDADLLAPGRKAGQEAGIAEQLAALEVRLATLEDGKTIAQLAQSGEAQLVENELRAARGKVGDPDAAPATRLEALRTLRRLAKTHAALFKGTAGEIGFDERDIVLPILELARNTTVDPELRAEAVENIAGSKFVELRQPLLDLLSFDQVPGVRGGAAQALMWHLDDATVREAIRNASRADPDETVRQRAESFLQKIEHFERLADEAAGTAPAGQRK